MSTRYNERLFQELLQTKAAERELRDKPKPKRRRKKVTPTEENGDGNKDGPVSG